MQSPQSQADCTNLQEDRPVCSGSEIPRQGRSPDFVLRGPALPGFPVVRTHTPAIWPVRRFLCRSAPVHSDCIAPDSHRIPFSPAPKADTLALQFYIVSDSPHYNTHRKRVNRRNRQFSPVGSRISRRECPKMGKCPADTGSAGRFGSSARDYCINVPAIIWSM